jgi:hypothetical protein
VKPAVVAGNPFGKRLGISSTRWCSVSYTCDSFAKPPHFATPRRGLKQ